MPRCIIYDNGALPRAVRRWRDGEGEDWQVETIDAIDALGELLPVGEQALVVYPADLSSRQRAELTGYMGAECAPVPFVCVVEDGDVDACERALGEGADDFLFESQFADEHTAAILHSAVTRFEMGRRDTRLRDELERRSSELLGLNALANGVSGSLDRQTIVRRGLWVFAGVCQQGAVGLVELDPPPDLTAPPSELASADEVELVCGGAFAADDRQLFGELRIDEGWEHVIFEDNVVSLEAPPETARFQGLDGFWEGADPQEGTRRLTIVPLQANGRPLGALVLGSVQSRGAQASLTREGLRAMALQFASALENARLFAKVRDAYESLQKAQDQLVHAEKFAAVGVLAAEIAHEINNPASFVISNLSVMLEYSGAIADFIDRVETEIAGTDEALADHFEQLLEEYEIGYLREDMDSLLSRSLAGMQRIHQVVQDLRHLSRDSGEKPGWLELDSLLEATVNLVRHEAKFRADLQLDYGDVPQVMSDASRLSQVFLNLLVNAVQSIEVGDVEANTIRVSTRRHDDQEVVVTVEDTGRGIPEDIQPKIFEPFFTTKETGDGTGLGLSISRDIIRSLGGRIEFESTPGEGSTFRVFLPIRAEKFGEDENLRDSGYYETPPGLDSIPDKIFGD